MGVSVIAPSTAAWDGCVVWNGTNASYFTTTGGTVGGMNMGSAAAGWACGWICFDPVNKAQGYSPADAWVDGRSARWAPTSYMTHPDFPITPFYWHGVDENDHVPPTTTGTWDTDHGLTTDAIVWDSSRHFPRELMFFSENLAPIITEICGRAGWVSGYALGLHADTPIDYLPTGVRWGLELNGFTWSGSPRLWLVDAGEIWARPIGSSCVMYAASTSAATSSEGLMGYHKKLHVPMPSGSKIGETLIGFITSGDDASYTWPSGWTVLANTQYNSAISLGIAWHKVDGNEPEAIDIALDAAEEYSVGVILRFTRAADPDSLPPEVSTVATGLSTSPDATSLSPSGGSKKYCELVVVAVDGFRNMSGWPSGFVELIQKQESGCSLLVGIKFEEAATLDPGAGTITSDEWIAYTLAIHPVDTVPTYYSVTKDAAWGVG